MPQSTTFIRRFWPLLFLALIPLIPLWRCVFLGEAIGPFDQIRQMAPWNEPKPAHAWDVLQADGVLQFYPWRDMVFKAWSQGQLPLWNPYELAGTPLLANSQSAGFYPLHIVMGILHVPTVPAMTLLAWFHLFWAGLGTYLLARRFGATKQGAAIGGACFQLSAFMLSWTGLPSVITTVAWIPWALAATAALFVQGTNKNRQTLLLALSLGMMLLAGHLQFAAYGFIAVAVLTAVTVRKPMLAATGRVLIGCLIGALLAAPQLLPVLNYSQFSHRKISPTAAGYEAYNALAIKPFELVGVVYPQLLGTPERYAQVEGIQGEIPAFWPEFTKRGANYAESAIGLGPLVLLLLFALRKPDWKRLAPVAAVGILGFVLATGMGVGWLLYNYFPGWSSTGSPGRASCLFVLAACVLAGVAASTEGDPKETSWKRLYAPVFALIIATVLNLALLPQVGQSLTLIGSDQGLREIVMACAKYGIALAMLGAFAAVAFGAVWLKKQRTTFWLFIGLVAWAVLSPSFALRTSPKAFEFSSPGATRYAIVNNNWDIIGAAPALFPPNTAAASGVRELAGYDSLLHRETKDLLDDINGRDSAPEANGNMMFIKPSADFAKLAEAGVTAVWSPKPLPGQSERPANERGFYHYSVPGPGRAAIDGGQMTFVSEGFSHLALRATGPGRLIVRDRNMPGWSAKLDGKKAPLRGSMWREVDIPAGEHSVEFSYAPPGLKTGLYLGVPAWLLLLVFAVLLPPAAKE